MTQLTFDEQAARKIEGIYEIADAARRRRIVRDALGAAPGERILDVGCGPGFYCLELLDDVGPTGSVVGVDSSPAMLALAARRCPGAELLPGDATALPVPDADFDAAISVQVQEYVADLGASLAELHRAVRPGGRVVVFDVDWATLSVHSEDPALSARVLAAWDGHLVHRSLPRTLAPRLRAAGFEDVRMDAHAFATVEYAPDRDYGAAVVPFIGAYVGGEDGEAWVAEQRRLGERGEFYFSVVQCCFRARKPR